MSAQMSFADFLETVRRDATAPAAWRPALRALWADARGDWDTAHELAQLADDAEGAWVHAYLHRKEGDLANAAYWYRRAGRPVAHGDLATEWRTLAEALVTREG